MVNIAVIVLSLSKDLKYHLASIYTKEARIARSFAKANSLYGVKFVCYLDEKWVFRITNEPELVVDPAYPPKYIIVTEEGEVRFSTPEDGNDVYQLTNVL